MSFDQDKRLHTYALTDFELYPGLTIHCRAPGYRATKELGAAVLVLGDDLTGPGLAGDALLDAFEPLFSALERSIIRWNLLDGGRSVPVSRLQDQDLEFLLDIARVWYDVVVQGKRPQPVDNPVDDLPAVAYAADGLPPYEPGPDVSLPPTIGEDGTDEEWLAQFASYPPPLEEPVDDTEEVDPATNEPWPVPELKHEETSEPEHASGSE